MMKRLAAANMLLVISYLVVPLLSAALVVSMEPSSPPMPPATALHDCPSMCGNISIPYPFGIGKGCSWPSRSFRISCNQKYNPPRAYHNDLEVIDIKLDAGEMRVFTRIAHLCYNSTNTTSSWSSSRYGFGESSAFVISPARNEFTGVGCGNVALLQGKDRNDDGGYLSGCLTTCASLNDSAKDGDPCSGNGCCQTAMPSGLNLVEVGWSIRNKSPVNPAWKFNRCSYGFIAEKGWYVYISISLLDDSYYAIR